MCTALDWLYRASGVLAGVSLIGIAAMTLAQIGGRPHDDRQPADR